MIQTRLQTVRQRQGLTAAELAARTGVRRQTIYAIEAGTYVPNTALALKLARVLGVTVEDLFALESGPEPLETVELLEIGERPHAGQPVRLCRVGDRMLGVPVAPLPFHLPEADGVLQRSSRAGGLVKSIRTGAGPRESLLVAGCDPAVSLLARELERRAGVELVAAGCPSLRALELLRDKKVHIAGSHLGDDLAAVEKLFPRGDVVRVTFAGWEEGLVVRTGNPKAIRGVADLARAEVTIVNREKGAGSRFLLDLHLRREGIRRVKGYDRTAAGHLAAAWHVHAGQADCCVATRAAARVFGLDFLPLAAERYELVIPKRYLALAAVEALLDVLQRARFRKALAAVGGYDTSRTGEVR